MKKLRGLEFFALRFAQCVAIARNRKAKLPAKLIDGAYSAYVEGDIRDLEDAVSLAAVELNLDVSTLAKEWKKLPRDARKETGRLAFSSN
jgi:hypothetical protein